MDVLHEDDEQLLKSNRQVEARCRSQSTSSADAKKLLCPAEEDWRKPRAKLMT